MSDITQDDEYTEAVRVVAWGEAGRCEDTPDGWPESVTDAKAYVRDYHARTSPPSNAVPRERPEGGPLTKLLDDLRSMD